MVKINGKMVAIIKGDSAVLNIAITTQSGETYTPQTGDKVRFAMKKRYTDANPLILKDIPTDTMQLEILPEDTASLPVGNYVYDMELTTADGFVDTFIPCSTFQICPEVH